MSKNKQLTKDQKEARKKAQSLTKAQLDAIGADATRLYEESQKQLVEYKMWLKEQIKAITTGDGKPLDAMFTTQMLSEVDKIEVQFTRIEPGIKATNEQGKRVATVSAMYLFPDLLMDTFRNPPDGLVIPKPLLKDFQSMNVLPERLPENYALPMGKKQVH